MMSRYLQLLKKLLFSLNQQFYPRNLLSSPAEIEFFLSLPKEESETIPYFSPTDYPSLKNLF